MAGQGIVNSCVILNGQTVSNEVDLGYARAVALETPAGFEGTSLTFNVASASGTDLAMYDNLGNQYTVTVGASRHVVLPVADFYGVRFIQIVSNNAVGANRQINILTEEV